MGFYCDSIVPHLVHLSMRNERLVPYRRRLAAMAEGCVLEIGIGSAPNLPYYPDRVEEVIGVEPAPRLVEMAQQAAIRSVLPVTLLEGRAEAIPLECASVDTVVTSWTMCTISDTRTALGEMRRVLRPGGQLLFVEHGRAPEVKVHRWQDRLTPLWRRVSGGCHLNRPIDRVIEGGGFRISRLDTGYAEGPKTIAYLYEGRAVPA